MSKKKNENMDPNVKRFLEEIEAKKLSEAKEIEDANSVVCPGCGEKIPKTARKCPVCGAKQEGSYYVPISDKKAAKIRLIVGTIMVIGFFIIYLFVLGK